MGFSVKLQLPVGFDLRWFLLAAAGAVLALVLLYLFRKRRAAADPAVRRMPPPRPQTDTVLPMTIEDKYLLLLKALREQFEKGQIDCREAYQQLSRIMRAFAGERTGKLVDSATLAEISKMHIPQLQKLIAEYYEPEFSPAGEADIIRSFENAGKVIKLWN